LRERWFGATRKRVPEIVVEGEFEFPAEPLVLDGPEVAAVLVPPAKRELLELDLVELTYG
jgi:hypothetical protein